MPRTASIQHVGIMYKHLYARASLYCTKLNKEYGSALCVDGAVLYVVVKSTLDDIERYKKYHLDEPRKMRSNSVKRVAYLTKWLIKMKPIVPLNAEQNTDPKSSASIASFMSNPGFALNALKVFYIEELGRYFTLTQQKEADFIYDMIYREINEDGLLAIFQDIFDIVSDKDFVVKI